ncbi:MAG TPA: F0F1 ATP synthase subunit alpha [Verrucomicrobiae bacterium]|nr:F0F1 ATP synthase subunit alpha [Verrucomicrobiae bacterium]
MPTPKKETFHPKEITEKLKKTLPDDVHFRPVITEIGEVSYVGDGICKVHGLPSVHIDDMIEIQTDRGGTVKALVLGINEIEIEAVVMGDYTAIRQGNVVTSSGELLQMPIGEALLGRVVNPLGEPIDGKGPVHTHEFGMVERLAPGVAKRQPVTEQFQSGVLVVDTIIPLGKGQRELVVGDRKSGKTKLMESFIINQKGQNIICVYVAIGAQKGKIRSLEERLRVAGAMDYTAIVFGGSDEPPSINYIAPYAGSAVAEYFQFKGKDVIIIYDDLSKHAKAYRQMSLLLKRSPGRDAYPGDIFYLHSRLLERSSRLHQSLGSGSITAFPMAETQNGDLSEYINTNLMSITDGHIFLDVNLMHEGILPAVNSGASVSRIGGSVQPPALRKCGELASTQMARYNEVKSFETLNTEISEDTEREIKRGKRVLATFDQKADLRLANDEKTILMYLVTAGRFDNIELPDVKKIKVELVEFYRKGNYPEFREQSVKEKDIDKIGQLINPIIADYVPTSQVEGAKYLIEEKKKEEGILPIVPDTAPPAEAGKEGEKKEEKK